MIKHLEDNEIEEVMDVWLKTNITAHNFIPEDYWIGQCEVVLEEYLPSSTTFVYKEDNVIKGFISIKKNKKYSFIGALFILEEYQQKGIGKKLVNHCKSLDSPLEVCAYVENVNAVNFYRHCGFSIISKQPNENSGVMEYTMQWKNDS
ncbi:N-acetyltransferase [Methanobacterium petrolearium]|uniref:N-acetyltransferase n=1 Tax=Methanobacterium petrolearium TaxID=710190 RepID=UPI001AE91737|nr:N-acetyltransferase [Methanobacterium petrolearium]MBP1946272.1 putative acetyltransferase [Methanobacterium petrolearium]BDZ71365.1 acetyltransferase [Methanobacterium petrolearium]